MKISVNSSSTHVIVAIEGRLDTTQSDAFEKQLLEVIESGQTKIILDCKALDYISSSGLRVFLIAQKKMMAVSGKLLLCNLQPGIKEIFEVSGFNLIFNIFPDANSAIKG